MKIGDRIFVRGYIDEIRKDTVIARNDGGYFGTIPSEVMGELPSAQPERKRGKWKRAYLDHEAMGERPSILYCSVCNQCIAYPVNYCPNCGARMKEEDA